MGAKAMRGKLVGVVAVLALLVVGLAAEAQAAGLPRGKALVVAYNAGQGGAIAVTLVAFPNDRQALVTLKPGDAAMLAPVRAGRAEFRMRVAGTGAARQIRAAQKLRAGHAYCAFVGGPDGLLLKDASSQLLVDPSPEKVCRQLAQD